MREVIYKNLISANERKKNIFLTEVFEKDGVKAKTERRCLYLVKEIRHMEDSSKVQEWLTEQNSAGGLNRRSFHIFRQHSDVLGEDRFICKVNGIFCVVVGMNIYTIAFLHSFKVTFEKAVA